MSTKISKNYTVIIPKRDFTETIPKRDFYAPISANRVVYDGAYPADAFVKWGQENIWPFEVGGADSTKTFGDLT